MAADAATWEKVVRKIRTGMMPPSGARRPERSVLDGFASELETRLDQAAPAGAALHAPALHRLNRTEYANAVRDLSRSTSTSRRCCRPMRRARDSTTSRKRWRSPRRWFRVTCPRR